MHTDGARLATNHPPTDPEIATERPELPTARSAG